MGYSDERGLSQKRGKPGSKADGQFKTTKNPFANTSNDFDFGSVDSVALGRSIVNLIQTGRAITFGFSKSSGVVSVTVLDGDDKHKTYCADSKALNYAMQNVAEMVADEVP